jgi:glycosidase
LRKGIDALRVDTVKHMPLWFWQEFTSDMVSERPDVFMFGEWIYSHPSDPASVEFANLSGMSASQVQDGELVHYGIIMSRSTRRGAESQAAPAGPIATAAA